MKLSILILSIDTPEHEQFLSRCTEELYRQIFQLGLSEDIEICINIDDGTKTKGQKRNEALKIAAGKYVVFMDDDDMPGPKYIEELMVGINQDVDCVSLRGRMTTDGHNPEIFEHSIVYNEYRTVPLAGDETAKAIKYERYPNHLNCIKADIAKRFKFPLINHGEDTAWATEVYKSGLIKTEYRTKHVIYQYLYRSKK